MTWRLHIQTACLIEPSMFSIVFMFYNPPWRTCWNREASCPARSFGHQGRLEEHELEAVRGAKVGKEKSDEPTVDGRSPAPAVICETP